MKLDVLTNDEFIKLATNQTKYNVYIINEWIKRFEIGFPYILCSTGEIYNVMLNEVVKDEFCDKFIVEQANKLRNK